MQYLFYIFYIFLYLCIKTIFQMNIFTYIMFFININCIFFMHIYMFYSLFLYKYWFNLILFLFKFFFLSHPIISSHLFTHNKHHPFSSLFLQYNYTIIFIICQLFLFVQYLHLDWYLFPPFLWKYWISLTSPHLEHFLYFPLTTFK